MPTSVVSIREPAFGQVEGLLLFPVHSCWHSTAVWYACFVYAALEEAGEQAPAGMEGVNAGATARKIGLAARAHRGDAVDIAHLNLVEV